MAKTFRSIFYSWLNSCSLVFFPLKFNAYMQDHVNMHSKLHLASTLSQHVPHAETKQNFKTFSSSMWRKIRSLQNPSLKIKLAIDRLITEIEILSKHWLLDSPMCVFWCVTWAHLGQKRDFAGL